MRGKYIFLFLLMSAPAHADFSIDSPNFDKGVLVLDSNNNVALDHRARVNASRDNLIDAGYGVTGWWQPTVQFEWDKSPGSGGATVTTIQNIFTLTQEGEHWVDAGIELNYLRATGAAPAMAEGKLLLEKKAWGMVNTLNLVLNREVGGGSSNYNNIGLDWAAEYAYTPMFNPGVEFYGNVNGAQSIGNGRRIGPVFYGDVGSSFSYELGWLFGVSSKAEDNVIKFNLMYKIPL